MRSRLRAYLALCSFVLLGSCKELQSVLVDAGYVHDLGDFKVERVEFVPEMPPFGHSWERANYLKIALSSSHKLSGEYPTYRVFVISDFCPLKKDHKLISLGVVDERGISVDEDEREPIKKFSDGLYHYQIFVVPSHPLPGKTEEDYAFPTEGPYAQKKYDIVEDGKDLCLQIVGGDHYDVFARSSIIRVDSSAIRIAAENRTDQ